MTQEDFIANVRQAYLNARKYIFKPTSNETILERRTNHSISSVCEDLFGCYCVNKVREPKNKRILIDPQISFKGTELKNKSNKRPLLVRPDIMISDNGIATCFFDIKTDLGYKRELLLDQAREKSELLKSIREQSCEISKSKFIISNDINLYYIVLSEGNMNRDAQMKLIKEIREVENIGIFLLTIGDHLNAYHDNPKWEINKNHFDELDKLLNLYLN